MIDNRDYSIDFLRFLGLTMIILAHTDVPGILFQARNFDVPLMVLISGVAYSLSHQKKERYISYISQRLIRLALPVWIFLLFYFSTLKIFSPNAKELDFNTIYTSFLFLGGIGYVWIIKVFLLISLIAPLLHFINKKIESDFIYLTLTIFFYCFYELVILNITINNIYVRFFVANYIYYFLAYSTIFWIGLRIANLPRIIIFFSALLFLGVFGFHLASLYFENNSIVSTQFSKYPPTSYYLSYSLMISLILWMLKNTICNQLSLYSLPSAFIRFVSKNSIWIYLWHIPFVENIELYFVLEFIAAYLFATTIVFIQVCIVKYLATYKFNNSATAKNILLVFTG